jgi:hypothetical protein
MSKLSTTVRWRATMVILTIVLIAALVTTTPKPWMLTIVGICLGCVSGYLNARAARKSASSMAIRAIAWVCGIGLLILAMAIAEDMFVGAWAASFAAYLLASILMMASIFHKQHLVAAGDGT